MSRKAEGLAVGAHPLLTWGVASSRAAEARQLELAAHTRPARPARPSRFQRRSRSARRGL